LPGLPWAEASRRYVFYMHVDYLPKCYSRHGRTP